MITNFSNVAECRINLHTPMSTSNKCTKDEIMNTVLFTIASKKMKHLGRNLTKEPNDENFKSLKRHQKMGS